MAILLNTCWRESVLAMVICLPLTVKVPAVTGDAKLAVPMVTLTSLVALRGPGRDWRCR
ncbi:MAG: hypothetical protein U1F98_04115 [Verrucomicrobiota bacterium]